MDEVNWYELNTMNPQVEMAFAKDQDDNKDKFVGDTRNLTEVDETVNERDDNIDDFYGKRDVFAVDALHLKEYEEFKEGLTDEELELLNSGMQFYEVKFTNRGGIPMPLILRFTFEDGTTDVIRIPAEIWRRSEFEVSKVFMFKKTVTAIRLDPFLETADTDLNNNSWPEERQPTRYELFQKKEMDENPMQRDQRVKELGN
jgi:hypothetical protein